MTDFQKQHGPFAVKPMTDWPNGPKVLYTCDAESRIAQVKESTDFDWLRAVMLDRDVQSTVRLAAERRLRKLHKQSNASAE